MNPAEDLGPVGLVDKLCRHYLKDDDRRNIFKPKVEKGPIRRKLKIKFYDALFNNLKALKARTKTSTPGPSMTELDKLFAQAYEFRTQRRFDDANKLEELVFEVERLDDSTSSSVQNVLKFLLCLAGTGSTCRETSGQCSRGMPIYHVPKSSRAVIPSGPLHYGDTQLQRPFEQFYMQYPRQIFEMHCDQLITETTPTSMTVESGVCDSYPGTKLSTDFFMAHGLLNDTHEKLTHLSLFGALVNSRMVALDARLELPDLDDDAGINVPSLSKITEYTVSPDEGFETNSSTSMITPIGDFTSSDMSEDIWELALKYKPSKNHTWETIGRVAGPTERPYVTEAGPQVFDEICKLREAEIKLMDPSFQPAKRQCISMKILVRDVCYLLTGVLSKTFMFDKNKQEFYLCAGIHLAGVSSEALNQLCTGLIECGTNYHRLLKFSQPPVLNSLYTKGLVFQALTGALRKYLHYYEACVLSIPTSKTVMEVNFMFHKIKPQIRFLAELCHCSMRPSPFSTSQGEEFPTGIKLLSYLYQVTLDNCGSDHYPVLLSILYTSCGPYIQFIQNWAYHGICQDNYEEFMIRVDQDYLFSRDKFYWTNGYEMVSQESEEMVPLFLKDLASDIFVCGKGINLLKLCCPEHFMCNLDEETIPQVTITFSGHDLAMLHSRCQAYVSRMEMIAKQKIRTRAEIKERAERAKTDLIQKARHAAVKEMDKFRAKLKEVRRLVDAKKRQQFHELKQQMEDDLERRHQVVLKEKEEDKARIDSKTRKEGEEMTEEQRLEEEARQELIAYYSQLTAEAAHREQKALWKIRRHKLDNVRQVYLQKSEDDLQEEMMQYIAKMNAPADAPVDQLDETIPTSHLLDLSVRQPATAPRTVITRNILDMSIPSLPLSEPVLGSGVGNLLDITIEPSSAHGISETDGRNLMDMSLKDLPNWAQRGLQNPTLIELDEAAGGDGAGIPLADAGDEGMQESENNVTSSLVNLDKTHDRSRWNVKESVGGVSDLPKWAQRGSTGTGANDGAVDLPSWAREELDDLDPKDEESKAKSGSVQDKKTRDIKDESLDLNMSGVATHVSGVATHVSGVATHVSGVATHVKMIKGVTSTMETEESESKPGIMMFEDKHSLKETEQDEVRATTKTVSGEHITQESKDNPMEYQYMPPQLRTPEEIYRNMDLNTSGYEIRQSRRKLNMGNLPKNILNKNVSEESKKVDLVIKSANIHGHHSDETKAIDSDKIRQMKFHELNVHGHSSKESEEHVKIVTQNVHGHSTDQSTLKDVDSVRLQKFKEQNIHGHSSVESKAPDLDTINKMKLKKFQAVNAYGHASSESMPVDTDPKPPKSFKRNKHGHSSDSTVQKLLYGVDVLRVNKALENVNDGENADMSVFVPHPAGEESVWLEDFLEPYQDNFDIVNQPPMVDITHDLYQSPFTLWKDVDKGDNHQYLSLPVLLKKSITAPLLAQISLVNKSIVSYFYHDLEIDRHFEAIRMYLFMEDGEFGQTLGEHLFEKLALNPKPQEVLNPVFLNSVLTKALRSSIHGDSDLAGSVSFVVKHVPHLFNINANGALECFDLTYKVNWPMNIVITDNCLIKYGKVFTFMLQLKRTVWTLKDIWYRLIRDPLFGKARNVPQVRQLQLFRHEMQCFVKVMQGYISNQIIHVSWQEFQDNLMNNVHDLDDLHHRHAEYLNTVVFRCLLNAKAAPVMKVIQDIFRLILRFHGHLTAFAWQKSDKTGEITHPNFSNLVATYKAFKDYSLFLFKVVNKLSARGYHPHLEEFLLRLNFNSYYTEHQPR